MKIGKLKSIAKGLIVDSSVPTGISYLWNYGSLLSLCLGIQIVTGVLLGMHYNPSVEGAFSSVEHIMRDVKNGWLLRYLHANGASIFFMCVYMHIGRGIYYGSYQKPRERVWIVGVIILLMMIGTAFLGYVLPYSQMSYWAAVVITNLVSAIPVVGSELVQYIWGGYSVENPTLNRFYSLHYLLPFVIAMLVMVHMIELSETGSNNPNGINSQVEMRNFHPYDSYKDLVGFIILLMLLIGLVCYNPTYLLHSDHFQEGNPMVTPTHIVPEWYFLPFYAILRSIPNKLIGVIAMGGAILILMALPWLEKSKLRGLRYRPLGKLMYWAFIVNFIVLLWIGQCTPVYPFDMIGKIATLFYFIYIILITPLLGILENSLSRDISH